MNLEMVCRICAKEENLHIKIFGEEGRKNGIPRKIGLCLPIVVQESDNFPKQICLNCLSKLNASYELYNCSLYAESIIKNVMQFSAQNNCEMVEINSKEEVTKMMDELGSKLHDEWASGQVSLRIGNTIYKVGGNGSQNDTLKSIDEQRAKKAKLEETAVSDGDTSNNEQEAKKAKLDEAPVAGCSGIMYTVGPLGQQYLRMPSAQEVMKPTALPHGEFNIVPMPVLPTFTVPPIQSPPQTVITTAPEVEENDPDIQILTPNKVSQAAKVIDIEKPTQRIASVKPMKIGQIRPVPITELLPMSSNHPTVTGPQVASAQGTVEAFPEIASLQTDQVVNNQEKSPSESLPIIISDNPTPLIIRSPISLPTNSEEETQDSTETIPAALEVPNKERDEDISVVQEMNKNSQQFPEDDIVHHNNKLFFCILCNKNFLFDTGLDEHRCN